MPAIYETHSAPTFFLQVRAINVTPDDRGIQAKMFLRALESNITTIN